MAIVPTIMPSRARKYGEVRIPGGGGRATLRKGRMGSSLFRELAPRCEKGGRSATWSTLPSTSACALKRWVSEMQVKRYVGAPGGMTHRTP